MRSTATGRKTRALEAAPDGDRTRLRTYRQLCFSAVFTDRLTVHFLLVSRYLARDGEFRCSSRASSSASSIPTAIA